MPRPEKLTRVAGQRDIRTTPDGQYRVTRRERHGYVDYEIRYVGTEPAATRIAVVDLAKDIRPAITAHRESGRNTWWPHLVNRHTHTS